MEKEEETLGLWDLIKKDKNLPLSEVKKYITEGGDFLENQIFLAIKKKYPTTLDFRLGLMEKYGDITIENLRNFLSYIRSDALEIAIRL